MEATATVTRQAPRAGSLPPLDRRSPRGRTRWYLIRVREGSEESTARALLRLVPRDLLVDCFPLRRERWFRRDGAWSLQQVVAYRGYVFAVTDDAVALRKALSGLTVQAEPAGSGGRGWMPLAPDAQAWFERSMDDRRVLRGSTAVIEGGVLRVTDGPLRGQEGRIRSVDRHRRRCMVDVADSNGGSFRELMAIDVPLKS